jgi:hypothetical protein
MWTFEDFQVKSLHFLLLLSRILLYLNIPGVAGCSPVHLLSIFISKYIAGINNKIRSLIQLLPCHSDSIGWCEIQVWSSSVKGLNACSTLKFINYYLHKLLLHMHINAHSNSIKHLHSSSFQRTSINPYNDADIQKKPCVRLLKDAVQRQWWMSVQLCIIVFVLLALIETINQKSFLLLLLEVVDTCAIITACSWIIVLSILICATFRHWKVDMLGCFTWWKTNKKNYPSWNWAC